MKDHFKSDKIYSVIDDIYKNLLETFFPLNKNLVNAGKAYVKHLNVSINSAKSYYEIINKIGQSTIDRWGITRDVGNALSDISDMHRDLHNQSSMMVKTFNLDCITLIEAMIDQESKNIQNEHKKFQINYKRIKERCDKLQTQLKQKRRYKTNGGMSTKNRLSDNEYASNVNEYTGLFHQNLQSLQQLPTAINIDPILLGDANFNFNNNNNNGNVYGVNQNPFYEGAPAANHHPKTLTTNHQTAINFNQQKQPQSNLPIKELKVFFRDLISDLMGALKELDEYRVISLKKAYRTERECYVKTFSKQFNRIKCLLAETAKVNMLFGPKLQTWERKILQGPPTSPLILNGKMPHRNISSSSDYGQGQTPAYHQTQGGLVLANDTYQSCLDIKTLMDNAEMKDQRTYSLYDLRCNNGDVLPNALNSVVEHGSSVDGHKNGPAYLINCNGNGPMYNNGCARSQPQVTLQNVPYIISGHPNEYDANSLSNNSISGSGTYGYIINTASGEYNNANGQNSTNKTLSTIDEHHLMQQGPTLLSSHNGPNKFVETTHQLYSTAIANNTAARNNKFQDSTMRVEREDQVINDTRSNGSSLNSSFTHNSSQPPTISSSHRELYNDSDIYGSLAISAATNKNNLLVKVVHPYNPYDTNTEERENVDGNQQLLELRVEDVIEVIATPANLKHTEDGNDLKKEDDNGWRFGRNLSNGHTGWYPESFTVPFQQPTVNKVNKFHDEVNQRRRTLYEGHPPPPLNYNGQYDLTLKALLTAPPPPSNISKTTHDDATSSQNKRFSLININQERRPYQSSSHTLPLFYGVDGAGNGLNASQQHPLTTAGTGKYSNHRNNNNNNNIYDYGNSSKMFGLVNHTTNHRPSGYYNYPYMAAIPGPLGTENPYNLYGHTMSLSEYDFMNREGRPRILRDHVIQHRPLPRDLPYKYSSIPHLIHLNGGGVTAEYSNPNIWNTQQRIPSTKQPLNQMNVDGDIYETPYPYITTSGHSNKHQGKRTTQNVVRDNFEEGRPVFDHPLNKAPVPFLPHEKNKGLLLMGGGNKGNTKNKSLENIHKQQHLLLVANNVAAAAAGIGGSLINGDRIEESTSTGKEASYKKVAIDSGESNSVKRTPSTKSANKKEKNVTFKDTSATMKKNTVGMDSGVKGSNSVHEPPHGMMGEVELSSDIAKCEKIANKMADQEMDKRVNLFSELRDKLKKREKSAAVTDERVSDSSPQHVISHINGDHLAGNKHYVSLNPIESNIMTCNTKSRELTLSPTISLPPVPPPLPPANKKL